jgi:xylulokinase
MKCYLVGVDLGTMGTRAAIFEADGHLLASAYEESKLHYPQPGWVEQDSEDFYGSSVRTIRECVESSGINPSDVAAAVLYLASDEAGWCTGQAISVDGGFSILL